MYLLPENAWTYELTAACCTSGTVAGLAVVIPDATPDGDSFTPSGAHDAKVAVANGPLPWPLVLRFIHFVETSGDIVTDPSTAIVTGALSRSLNSWRFADRAFEVTSFHDGGHDGWCYELYEVDPTSTSNDYIDVRIPDLQPADGPFVPADAQRAALAGHGSPELPWPVFCHFLDAVHRSGDIVEHQD
jgi:hypothetical protein